MEDLITVVKKYTTNNTLISGEQIDMIGDKIKDIGNIISEFCNGPIKKLNDLDLLANIFEYNNELLDKLHEMMEEYRALNKKKRDNLEKFSKDLNKIRDKIIEQA